MAKTPADDDENKKASGRRKPRLMLELPPDVKEALDRSAYANARTRTAEIVLRLRQSFEGEGGGGGGQRGGLAARERNATIVGWFGSPAPELAETEQQLVADFRRLSESQRAAVLQLLQVLP